MTHEVPAFSRTDKGELRGLCPNDLLQALDAIAHSENLDRTAYVNKVLDEHVKAIAHKQILLSRMLRGNPYLQEPNGGMSE